jgi:hypothetical protein
MVNANANANQLLAGNLMHFCYVTCGLSVFAENLPSRLVE